MRVLHVEDNPVDADLTRRRLARRAPDIELEQASRLSEALEHLGTPGRYDLALLDLRLPDGSGLDALAWIRERRLPLAVVVLTGSGDQDAAIAALQAGADDYLSKGERTLERLPATLRDAWRRFRLAQTRQARPLRVLYAEHNPADIDLTRRHLARYAPHIRLTMVQDASQILEHLPADPHALAEFDLLLLDYRLPGLDALETIKILRAERGLDIPIIMVSGQGNEEVAARAIHLGANDSLSKHSGYLHQLPATLEKAWSLAELGRERANLRATSERLELALATSPVILYSRRLSPDAWPLTWVSENSTRLLGYSPTLALQPGWWASRLHPEDRETALRWLSELNQGGERVCAYRLIDAQGRVRWIQDEVTVLETDGGATHETTGAWHDVTLTKIAEQMREIRLAVLDALIDTQSLTEILGEIAMRLERLEPDMQVCIQIGLDGQPLSAAKPPPARPADWVAPFKDGAGQTIGCLRVHYAESRAPTPIERELIEECACIAGLAVTRVRADTRLRQAATVFESTREGVIITDLNGQILNVNRAFTEISGYSEPEVLGRNPRLLRSNRQDQSFYQSMWASLKTTGQWQGEIWNRRKSGELYPQILTINTVADSQGRPSHYVGVMTDISQLKQSEARLEHLVHYDPLTNLPNRRLVQSRLQHALEHADRRGGRVAVLFVDLDRFKNINDSLGHPAGDTLLESLAQRLSQRVREDDTLARLGGDEFLVLLENLQRPEDAAGVAQTLLDLLQDPFYLPSGHELYVGASIGISLYPDDGRTVTDLIQHADVAMYQAKEEGRNTYRFYTPNLTETAQERLGLEARLHRALASEEFVLHYQAQVDMRDGQLIGCEALVRWNSATEGLVAPDRFIPLAEETGLIVPLGEWVLRQACAQGQSWRAGGLADLTVAVNLSGRQLRAPDLVERVTRVLEETGLPPARLKLELTESMIMGQGERALDLLRGLKRLGVRLSIDDFGTGYSSLAYLKRLPIDELKIDRDFVRDIPADSSDMEIAATIIAMARNLRLNVIAEGVETSEQCDFLIRQGCMAGQGYLFGRPQPAEDFTSLLSDHQTAKHAYR
ncbi:EAL domain-containing protein [Allochromatium palmeri]|uniref:cyclic-guanylate-specific phosphodiesterase n=1 Tax=Allochromatium palmeri TaxID=231048 RepID=A0A6N8EA24_9GAMM|nr:EAL domain-containing protein [Allochromatium palmeri]MTW19689.1 EAL domain-containing protein [Allochromatium palmeri]